MRQGTPRLEFDGIYIKPIVIHDDLKTGLIEPRTEPEEEAAFPSFLLKVVNLRREEGDSRKAMNVTARIRFYGVGFTKFIDVEPGVWIGSPCASTSIEVGSSSELFIVIGDPARGYSSLRDLRNDRLAEPDENGFVYYVRGPAGGRSGSRWLGAIDVARRHRLDTREEIRWVQSGGKLPE